MKTATYDLVVIGGGPGGYPAAIRAAQLGLSVGCIERESALGGTCVRVGCIPSKALLESSERFVETRDELSAHGIRVENVSVDIAKMLARKTQIVESNTKGVDFLFKKNKIKRYRGSGKLLSSTKVLCEGEDNIEIEAKNILIATGSTVAMLPGVELDYQNVVTSTEALSFDQVPQHLVVIGAGYIGLELGSVWRRLGAKVTVLEYLDRILPGMDFETATEAHKLFQKQGLEFKLNTKVLAARSDGDGAVVEIEGGEAIRADKVLLAVGRAPNTQGLNIEALGVQVDERGRIKVDDGFATNVPGVFAIGDVIAGPMLAHKATEEGIACVEKLVTGYGHVNYNTIPGIVYTAPEIATVGQTEDALKATPTAYRKGVFPFSASGRARCMGHTDGRVKILADAITDRILGVHIIGPRAGDLIAEAVAAMEFGASSEDLARTCHAHPTLSEAIHEAALAVDGRAIHI
ncbi:MAG: dihydrolipoamide dehydrogenase [Abditibacteriota bacterium]|nr:dihydrolipoamide dehydrogenase [Abditibacteriota bacterium]